MRNFSKPLSQQLSASPEPDINWNNLTHALIRLSWGVSLGVFPYLKDVSKIEVGKIPKEQPSVTKLLEGEEVCTEYIDTVYSAGAIELGSQLYWVKISPNLQDGLACNVNKYHNFGLCLLSIKIIFENNVFCSKAKSHQKL